jgi:hypothetical protein
MTSAFPPEADIERLRRHVRVVPQPDSCTAAKTQSFDHLIGQLLNVHGDIEAKHPGRLQVDPQFDPRRLLVCTENLNPDVVMVKAAEDRV